jgi:hypothetical protein
VPGQDSSGKTFSGKEARNRHSSSTVPDLFGRTLRFSVKASHTLQDSDLGKIGRQIDQCEVSR